jgi:hypothetical protein
MTFIHGTDERSLRRLVGRVLDEHLRTMPAVVLTGARQTGSLFHAGQHTEWLAPDVLAVPWWRVP